MKSFTYMTAAFGLAVSVSLSVSVGRAQTDLLTVDSSKIIATAGSGQFMLFNPASTALAATSGKHLEMFRLADGAHTSYVDCSKGRVSVAASSQDGAQLAAGCDEGLIVLSTWNGEHAHELAGKLGKRINSLSFSPDGSQLVSAGEDKNVVIWRLPGGTDALHLTTGSKKTCVYVAFSSDGLSVIGVTQDGEIDEWDSKTGRVVRRTNLDENSVFSAGLSADGKLLAVGGEFAGIGRGSWGNTPNGMSSPHSLSPSPARIGGGPGINPGDYSRDDRILLFDLVQGKVVKEIDGLKGQLRGLSISSDNRFLAAALQKTKGTCLSVFDLQRGVEILTQPAHDRAAMVGFSPNGSYLADASLDGQLQLMTISGVQHSSEEDFAGRRIRPVGLTSPIVKFSKDIRLAIVDLEPLNFAKDKDVGRTVAEMLRSAIVSAGVQVVRYDLMQEIIKQQNFQQSIRTDAATAVSLGKIVNASQMLLGSVSALGTTYLVTLHLVDVETATEKGSREVQCDRCTDDDLARVVKELRAITVQAER